MDGIVGGGTITVMVGYTLPQGAQVPPRRSQLHGRCPLATRHTASRPVTVISDTSLALSLSLSFHCCISRQENRTLRAAQLTQANDLTFSLHLSPPPPIPPSYLPHPIFPHHSTYYFHPLHQPSPFTLTPTLLLLTAPSSIPFISLCLRNEPHQ